MHWIWKCLIFIFIFSKIIFVASILFDKKLYFFPVRGSQFILSKRQTPICIYRLCAPISVFFKDQNKIRKTKKIQKKLKEDCKVVKLWSKIYFPPFFNFENSFRNNNCSSDLILSTNEDTMNTRLTMKNDHLTDISLL